jgi:hypothetical protein
MRSSWNRWGSRRLSCCSFGSFPSFPRSRSPTTRAVESFVGESSPIDRSGLDQRRRKMGELATSTRGLPQRGRWWWWRLRSVHLVGGGSAHAWLIWNHLWRVHGRPSRRFWRDFGHLIGISVTTCEPRVHRVNEEQGVLFLYRPDHITHLRTEPWLLIPALLG